MSVNVDDDNDEIIVTDEDLSPPNSPTHKSSASALDSAHMLSLTESKHTNYSVADSKAKLSAAALLAGNSIGSNVS